MFKQREIFGHTSESERKSLIGIELSQDYWGFNCSYFIQTSIISPHLGSLAFAVKPHARNLGVIFDSVLIFDKSVGTELHEDYFYHLKTHTDVSSDLEKGLP